MGTDKDYVIDIILYLQNKHDIIFFITTKDFDMLYNWWEKRIPPRIVKESILNVILRWKEKGKKISSFTNFRYEVKKNFQAFLQLDIGSEISDKEIPNPGESDPNEEIDFFFNHYPEELTVLQEEFKIIYQKIKDCECIDLDLNRCLEKMVDLFKDDNELNVKVKIFLNNLTPELRKPEIEQRYRLNYLINKFNIPDFQSY